MKKVYFYFLFGIAALLAACSNEVDSVIEPAHTRASVSNVFSLDLQSLDYNALAEVLTDVPSTGREVILEGGTYSRTVVLQRVLNMDVIDEGSQVDLFEGRANDSIDAALSPIFATLRLYNNGELINYVAYKNDEDMAEIADYYQTQFLPSQTRSINEIVTLLGHAGTRSMRSEIGCVRINSTKAIECNPNKVSLENDYLATREYTLDTPNSLRTRDNVTPVLPFYLIKDKSSNNLDHEILWQVESTCTSLHFLVDAGFFRPLFYIWSSEFEGRDGSWAALSAFQTYLKGWSRVSGEDDRIFIQMKNGTWDNGDYLGMVAETGMIHLNIPDKDFNIRAISSSSSLYPHTLAHEIGHLFGALHTDIKEDLMYAFSGPKVTAYHKSADNWDRMLNCFLLKP